MRVLKRCFSRRLKAWRRPPRVVVDDALEMLARVVRSS